MPVDSWDSSRENILNGSNTEKPVDAGPPRKSRKIKWIVIATALAVIAFIIIIFAALAAKGIFHHSPAAAADGSGTNSTGDSSPKSSTGTSGSKPTSTAHNSTCSTADDIPSSANGTWLDTTSWLDMTDFNCTYTNETVGGLPIVGLNSTWDNSKQANTEVPSLENPWGSYTARPFRGVNLGGWLSLEPFITDSLFEANGGIVDEWTLCTKLGPAQAAKTLEQHYSTFITEDDFKAIAAAGLDHVRIPYSYWAVQHYDGDPYVFGVSWRYLLRGIEWARKYGIRVNLDLHAVPGSQNGWNHSGRSGKIDWILGPDGALNAQRTLDIHKQLSTFFAQPRYQNIITFYGLVNEPAPSIPEDDLVTWTAQAYQIVKDNGITATQVFSESMRGLPAWNGKLTGYGNEMAIDVHEYTLFDNNTIGLKHADRIGFACDTFADQVEAGMNPSIGYGPTMVGEWSQADTDCTKWLNGVNTGARWDGTFFGTAGMCPTQNSQCNCAMANANASTFTAEYKQFLQDWAEAQMFAFEKSWGWFYWTWKTESAPLWSYQAALQGNFMPPIAYQRSWDCSQPVQSFGSLPEFY